jgi:hypothetical protein
MGLEALEIDESDDKVLQHIMTVTNKYLQESAS